MSLRNTLAYHTYLTSSVDACFQNKRGKETSETSDIKNVAGKVDPFGT